MSIEKFQSILRRKLGLDQESLKDELREEIGKEVKSEFEKEIEEFEKSLREKERYLSTLIDSIEGRRELEDSRRILKRGNIRQDLSPLKRELRNLEERLKRNGLSH